ncbi:torsin-1A-interacting protein 2-like isoform X1 [Syngnathus typhle]|uniref:torsin-1A-interacting protein 2-like isoform X1 n=1 Tax=Syngnathus typhle TaxID=161592 RepID=UPI002A699CE1|nr:torsin-1A-interacting protein 2-like isoform X1 [Syngnathus typhle]
MDTDVSENAELRTLRRPTRRQSTEKTFICEVTARGPIKRSKRGIEKQAASSSSVPKINESRNVETGSEDEVSPGKKSRLEEEEMSGDSCNKKEMDLQESALEENEDQEMDIEGDSVHSPDHPETSLGDVKLSPFVALGKRYRISENTDTHLMKLNEVKTPSRDETDTFRKHSVSTRSSASIRNVQSRKITSMDEYKKKMEAKDKGSGISTANHRSVYTPSVTSYPVRHRANNIPIRKEPVSRIKKAVNKTQGVTRGSSGGSSRGVPRYLCWSVVIVLLLSSAAMLLYKDKLISLYRTFAEGARRPSRSVKLQPFADLLSQLEARFRSQRPELWKRSKIHLEKHLKSAEPTEPVSLILTSGRGAEKTLSCLAEGLASAFSSALESSVLQIDGAGKAAMESDEVKLDMDGQLRAAFGGNRAAAVIHRFEELPPGSTLIFYRYCDHEHAAYKEVFLLFTVLLPQEEVSGELGAVEEMVQDYLKDRLVDSSNQTAFNEMDTDKFGGLWSRISHLVLPVVAEEDVEQNGC